jgi:hypothetical protein
VEIAADVGRNLQKPKPEPRSFPVDSVICVVAPVATLFYQRMNAIVYNQKK